MRTFWQEHEQKIIFALSFVLIAILSFEIGIFQGKKMGNEESVIIIEKASEIQCLPSSAASTDGQTLPVSDNEKTSVVTETHCQFIGSKNSDKYHSPSCRWAKQIKPENRVCFSSAEDAQAKGYVEGCIE